MECLESNHQEHNNASNASNGSFLSILNTDSFFRPASGGPSRPRYALERRKKNPRKLRRNDNRLPPLQQFQWTRI